MLKVSEDNRKSRMNFIEYWANYVKTHSDEDWGRQQKMLIDSMLQSAKASKMTPEQYLRMKNEWKENWIGRSAI